ncbi:MAG: hypothetical protein M1822_007402 [Bathelium mastoideum]|nr:MAG: hypothetical protein M1822_007402 [Bathelium mastoideum]
MALSSGTSPSSDLCLKLRKDLEDLCISNDDSVQVDQGFLPKSKIKKLCTKNRIKAVLQCSCKTCQEHQQEHKSKRDPTYYLDAITGEINSSHLPNDTAVILFALLTFIECPSLIYLSVDKGLTDGYVEKNLSLLTPEHIRRTYWPTIREWSSQKFSSAKYRFFVPSLKDSDEVEQFPSDTIFPFLRQSPIDLEIDNVGMKIEGRHGRVFAFDIHAEYRAFSGFAGVRRFARKELHSNTCFERFNSEYQNLLYVNKLNDEHLVRLVKAYKHGDHYNFIFPCAKTNLRLYLRQPHWHQPEHKLSIIEHPIWNEMLHLARGLHKVLDCEEPGATHTHPQDPLFGHHLDLKPSNILVQESGSLLISDFGQANFKRMAEATSSNVGGMGGTETYAPPELDSGTKLSRRYDIWSFGCILLEVICFVVEGCQNVQEFDHLRSTEDLAKNSKDDRFCRRKTQNSYELKPEVMQHVELLKESVKGQEKDFLVEMLSLVLRMLEVNVDLRLTSKGVCIHYSEILRRFESRPRLQPDADSHEAYSPTSGREVGKELIEGLPVLSYNIAGFWTVGPVHFVQNEALLRVDTLKDKIWKETPIGDVTQTRFTPRYAFHERKSHYYSDACVYFSPDGQSMGKFSAGSDHENDRLQQILLGQEVRCNVKLKTVEVRLKDRSVLFGKFNRKRGGSMVGQSQMELKASSVQLWVESSGRSIADMITPVRSSKKSSPRSLRSSLPPPRIVIFCSGHIIIIRFKKNVRIGSSPHLVTQQTALRLVPTDPSTDASFTASVFTTGSGELLPSFPLTRDKFEIEEVDKSQEYSDARLEFYSLADAQAFHRRYKALKKKFLEEAQAFESHKSRIGPELGFAAL